MAKNIGKKGIEDDKTLRKSGRWDNLGPLVMGWPKTSEKIEDICMVPLPIQTTYFTKIFSSYIRIEHITTVAVRENVACICTLAWAPGGVALRSLCRLTSVCIEMHQKKFHLNWITHS